MSQQALWRYWAKEMPHSVALTTEQGDVSWLELEQTVARYAGHFQSIGICQGSIISVVGKNHPDAIWCLLAAMQVGAICTFIAPAPLTSILDKLDTLYPEGAVRWVSFSPDSEYLWQPLSEACLYAQCLTLRTTSGEVDLPLNPYSIATLVFTSGSTGKPKAVAHSINQHVASAHGVLARLNFETYHTWLLSLPLYHVSGLAIVYRWLVAGGTLKMGSGHLLDDIVNVTHASLVPTQLRRLLKEGDVSSLQAVLLGGSHIPAALAQKAAQYGVDTWLGYGMTEAASTVTMKRVDDNAGCGSILAGRQVDIRDGQIFIGGDTLAMGYYQHGELVDLADSEGWYASSDLGYWQEDSLVISGRADNMFISGGENIHCEEIEQVLLSYPAITAAIVIPVADCQYGYRPIALVKGDVEHAQSEDFTQYLNERLVRFKHPIAYFAMPEIESSGIKVSRVAMKEWFSASQTEWTVMR